MLATSGSKGASRVQAIAEHENVDAVRKAEIRIEVHAGRKLASAGSLTELPVKRNCSVRRFEAALARHREGAALGVGSPATPVGTT